MNTNFKCLVGFHEWSLCQCVKCGTSRAETHASHNWSADCEKCAKCGKTRDNAHNWLFCKCQKCGKSRDESHDWLANCEKCARCGKGTNHVWCGDKCSRCGRTRTEASNGLPSQSSVSELADACANVICSHAVDCLINERPDKTLPTSAPLGPKLVIYEWLFFDIYLQHQVIGQAFDDAAISTAIQDKFISRAEKYLAKLSAPERPTTTGYCGGDKTDMQTEGEERVAARMKRRLGQYAKAWAMSKDPIRSVTNVAETFLSLVGLADDKACMEYAIAYCLKRQTGMLQHLKTQHLPVQ